ncbi:hypothetical protein DFH09DRAFT_1412906 [Mycena vulgaris]|nr:hypothetical protein DFH09DRAFT_1412906 [Mycena vulgaris]
MNQSGPCPSHSASLVTTLTINHHLCPPNGSWGTAILPFSKELLESSRRLSASETGLVAEYVAAGERRILDLDSAIDIAHVDAPAESERLMQEREVLHQQVVQHKSLHTVHCLPPEIISEFLASTVLGTELDDFPNTPCDPFEIAPELRQVSLEDLSGLHRPIVLPFSQLTRFESVATDRLLAETLPYTANLERASLNLTGDYPQTIHLIFPPIRLPILRHLFMSHLGFLRALELPALEELYMASPTLETLAVVVLPGDKSNDLMHALTVRPISVPRVCIGTRVESIAFGTDGGEISQASFMAMVESRWRVLDEGGPCCRLRSVELVIQDSESITLSRAVMRRLQALEVEGLQPPHNGARASRARPFPGPSVPGRPCTDSTGVVAEPFLEGLRVNLGLHTAPGSQNGDNHSDKLGQANFLNGVMGVGNAERALDYIWIVTDSISQPGYRDALLEAHNMIRGITGYGAANGPFMSIHDGFQGVASWASGSDRIILDTHPYFAFDQQPNDALIAIRADYGGGGLARIAPAADGVVRSRLWSYQTGLDGGWMPTDPRTALGKYNTIGVLGGAGAGMITATATFQFGQWPPATISHVDVATLTLLLTHKATGSAPQATGSIGNGCFDAMRGAILKAMIYQRSTIVLVAKYVHDVLEVLYSMPIYRP